jgi:hypothetical protein
MHKMMTTMGGVDPKYARLYTGEQATLANFEQSVVKWLPSITEPGDTLFIYYSGHGGQVKARDDTEIDGLDELISMYDSDTRTSEGTWDERIRKAAIVDDTLARWLQELRGRQIVLILDTCHGGGAVDGVGLAKSFVEEANRVRDISQLNTVVVCGCLPDESVWFTTGPKKMMLIPATFGLAMIELPKPVTVRDAFAFYRKHLNTFLDKIGVPFAQEPSLTHHALLPIALVPKGDGNSDAPNNNPPQTLPDDTTGESNKRG